jgi:hypothetical protein
MPEGSPVQKIHDLQTALAAITALLGDAPAGDGTGSGLAGAAGLAASSPADRVAAFRGQFTRQASGALSLDSTAALNAVTGLFASLKTEVQSPPTQALAAFQGRVSQANAVFSGDLVQRIQQALDAIRGISQGVPQDRSAIVSSLLDQILGVLASLQGPEAEKIRSWVQSVQELHSVLMPLIEQARTAADPQALVVEVVQRSLNSTLDTLGFGRVKGLVDFLDSLLGDPVSQTTLHGISTGMSSTSTAYAQALGVVNRSYAEFQDAVAAAAQAGQDLRNRLRPAVSAIRRVAGAKILQPNALEIFLRAQMDRALSVRVQEVQKIDDPYKELFDRIDAAIAGIDLSFVRTEVLGFFQTTRDTIQQVDIASVDDFLQGQLGAVEQTVLELQQGVTDLLAQLKAFFDNLTQQYRTLAGNVGEFKPDGAFQFHVEQHLRGILTSARLAIGGDPANPTMPSVAGSLNQFQASIDQFLAQLDDLLGPVEDGVDNAKTTAVDGINSFSTYLQGLDVPALMEQLRQKVDEILDALLPIDFDVVVDPVVAMIQENTEKLRSIDTSSLNDMLREALKVALDVIIQIDFTATISTPLKEQFQDVKAVPQDAVKQLQQRYEEAIARLDDLKPSQLLEALFAAFDVVDRAVSSLNVAALLQSLDALHQQHLQRPLAQLKPSVLLKPASDSFQGFTAVLKDISGAAIIAPVNSQLNELKGAVAGFDIAGWVDDLVAAVEKVKQDLRDIRPSGLLQPLVEDFNRLEAELDHFKPSVVFQPVAELAAPLLAALENVQQQTVEALFQAFHGPLQALDRLRPEELTRNIQERIDALVAALNSLNVAPNYNQLKGRYFDLKQAVTTGGDPSRAALVEFLDPERQLGEVVDAYNGLIAALQGLKQNVQLASLTGLYDELRERMLAMLPPYARELLNPETFKRLMRLADPTRFLQELDQRFEALKAKLIPIRPQDITAELDATYEAVLALVDGLEIEDSLKRVKDVLNRVRGIVEAIRVDFLAGDIDKAVRDFRAMVDALDPARLFDDLDALHHEVELVVQATLPSKVLAGLQAPADRVKAMVANINPRVTLGPPLDEAWASVQGVLDGVDFTVVLSPIVDKLDELEQALEASLRRTEDAFDQMLGAARGALSGDGVSAGAGVTI